ncbi:calcium-binding protein [Cypionkella sp.]|uniref:calcium-binding protein n=1 Tax=Cypionkella sp. TaxID=2811411 RepID=UPI002ABD088F|nr:calcium-binding protein [Cypionkella sp.]MDZ4394986.1 calcium-binding protein [Cypionkella sp.]
MSTYTIQGFSRVINYDSGLYQDYAGTTIQAVRQDPDSDFLYSYPWIDETGMGPKFAEVIDPWSQNAGLTREGSTPMDMCDDSFWAERQVFSVTWATGKTAYVYAIFQPVEGIEHYFFIGGDIPTITSLATLNSFLAQPHDYVLDGPFEAGNAIALAGFANTTVSQDDWVTARADEALHWNAGLGNDTITGNTGNDVLNGGAGNDVITSGGGSDTIWGAAGDDSLTGGSGYSNLLGGEGNDTLIGVSSFGEFLSGGAGNDYIEITDGQQMGDIWVNHGHTSGGSGDDTIYGGLAGDVVQGGNGNDMIVSNEGDDWVQGGNGNDEIYGYSGNDRLDGNANADSVMGGTGDDVIDGGTGIDSLYGEEGNDTLLGGADADDLYGGLGDDSLSGGTGNDRLYGDAGNDILNGDTGNDQVYGGAGNDLLRGSGGNDLLRGDAGADTLYGDAGIDTLWGGAGADVLIGGIGADVFRFTTLADSTAAAKDKVLLFELSIDDIDLATLDANPVLAGNQAFTFIETDAFSAVGQVRVSIVGTSSQIEVNTVGTSGAEMVILVQNVIGLLATDFLL